jgi:hypothetical protein
MRAQLAMYAVLGVLLLLIVGLLGYIFFISSPPASAGFDSSDVEFMISNCIKKIGKEGLDILGKNGNYMEIPAPLIFQGASYWIVEHANVMPVLNSSVGSFQEWFDRKFMECTDYSDFNYEISAGRGVSSISYGAETVIFDVFYPVNVSRAGRTKYLADFHESVDVKYRRAYERAREIVNAHFGIEFDYRNALKGIEKDGFGITYRIIDENNLVFSVSELIDKPFVFSFATNLDKSLLKRTVRPDALPYRLFSPDKKAVVSIIPPAVQSDELYSWVDYSTDASANVATSVAYTVQGDSVDSSKSYSDIGWLLSYPVYVFGPENLLFSSPQVLTISWDDSKNPNLGPVGLLYKGARSNGIWIPIPAFEDYLNNSVSTLVTGFSEYTIIDCARQGCKSAEVSATSKPKSKSKCSMMRFSDPSADFQPGQTLAVSLLIDPTLHLFTSVSVSKSSFMLSEYFFKPYVYEESETAVTFIPTCDQIVVVSCIAGSHLKHGSCDFNGEYLAPGSIREFNVEGGVSQVLTASASECEMSKKKCNSCSIKAVASYK